MKNKITILSIFLFFGLFSNKFFSADIAVSAIGSQVGTENFVSENSAVSVQDATNFLFCSPLCATDLFSEEDLEDDLNDKKIKTSCTFSVLCGDFDFPNKNPQFNFILKDHTHNSGRYAAVKTHIFYCVHRL